MKTALRAYYKSIRAGLDKKGLSVEICKNCLTLSTLPTSRTVLLYAPKGDEADILPLFDTLIEMGKTVCFPRCVDGGNMVFHKVTSLSQLKVGQYGIREPQKDLSMLTCEDMGESSLCLVPALAYDRRGYRLGYGGGYYDRFLSAFPGTAVGIAYDACLTESLFREAHDIKTDYIITESQVTKAIED